MNGPLVSLIASAVTGVFMLLLGTISWFLRDRVKENDQKMARMEEHARELEQRQATTRAEIEKNSEQKLSRIEERARALEMQQVQSGSQLEQIAKALESIGELRAEMALRYVSRDELAKMMSRIEQMRDEVQRVSIALAARGLGLGEGKVS